MMIQIDITHAFCISRIRTPHNIIPISVSSIYLHKFYPEWPFSLIYGEHVGKKCLEIKYRSNIYGYPTE